MKLSDAKAWVQRYIVANKTRIGHREFNKSLNWEIVKLSHEVFRGHGLRGHLIRRKVRRQLWSFADQEIAKVWKPSVFRRLKRFILGRL